MSISERTQSSEFGELVELFEVDFSEFGQTNLFLTPTGRDTPVIFNGQEYEPIALRAIGFEYSGTEQMPRPVITIADISGTIGTLADAFDDLAGAQVTRTRTFSVFLDGEPDADPTATLPIDVYLIHRRIAQNRATVEIELISPIDQEAAKIPGRQYLRDTCTQIYRRFDPDTNDFDYSRATCPYVGAANFTVNNSATSNPAEDVCSKRVSGCQLRFGQFGDLPTWAFPGLTRIR